MAKKRITERIYSDTLGMSPIAYQRYIEKLIHSYENDKSLSVSQIARMERERGIQVTGEKLRRIFAAHNVTIRIYRPPSGFGWGIRKPNRRFTKLTQTIRVQDVNYLQTLASDLGHYRLVKEYIHLGLCLLRGEPTPHAITFFGASMPVIFLYDYKIRKYEIVSPEMSVMDEDSLSELVSRMNMTRSPNPLHAFCAHKGLFLYGATIDPWETKWN